MKIHTSGNPQFFPGGVVEWGDGSKEVYLEAHPSAARMLGDKPGEAVEFGGKQAEAFAIDGRAVLKYG
jgi:hypothetical protein